MTRALLMLAAVLVCGAGLVQAAEVSVSRDGAMLSAHVHAIAFPANLSAELESGLANRLYARVSLLDRREVIGQRAVEVMVRYDLWDERFLVVSTVDEAIVDSRKLANVAEVNSLLSSLPLPRLFSINGLPNDRDLTIRVELLLNPVSREKARMIRKWVSQNTAPTVAGEQGPSMSNTIFNRIFEQYSGGSDMAAVWRTEVASEFFRLGSLK